MAVTRVRILTAAFLAVAALQGVAHAGELEFTGRVVDELRRPVADAALHARNGAQHVRVRSDDEGRFRFTLIGDPRASGLGCVVVRAAREGGDLAAFMQISNRYFRRRSVELTFVLKPVETAVVRVLAADDTPMPGVQVQIVTPSRFSRAVIEELASDTEGRVTVRMPKGQYTVVVSDPRYAGYGHLIELPVAVKDEFVPGFDPLVLRPKAPRRIEVRIVDSDTNAPLQGVRVVAAYGKRSSEPLYPMLPLPVSNEDGVAVFERIPVGQRVWISARTQGPARSGGVEVGSDETEAELRLERGTTHTAAWPIRESKHSPPPGSALRFRTDFHRDRLVDRPGTFDGTQVVVPEYHAPSDYGYAIYDEERAAFLTYELEERGTGEDRLELVSQSGRFLSVIPFGFQVVDATGQPLAGATIYLEGRYLFRDADGRLTRAEHERVQLDADGRFESEGVFFKATRVKAVSGRGVPSDFQLGTFFPQAAGETPSVFKLPPVRQVEAHVTLDGVPGVHAEIDFYFNGHIRSLEFDPERGIVRFPLIHDEAAASHYFSVSAPGYVSTHPSLDFSLPDPLVIKVELRTSLDISLVLDPEPEHWVSGSEIELHRFDADKNAWQYAGDASYGQGSYFPIEKIKKQGHRCWRAFVDHPPGRYRFVHTPTGLTTGPFEIDTSKSTWVVALDVLSHRKVTGRLVGADDIDLSGAWIVEQDGVPGLTWMEDHATACRAVVGEDNTFSLNVPSGREPTYIVKHPLLRETTFRVAHKQEDPIEVPVAPKAILRIPLKQHAEEAFREISARQTPGLDFGFFPDNRTTSVAEMWEARWLSPPYVHVRVEREDKITWRRIPRAYLHKEKVLLVPFDEPGTYTLWIDAEYLVPVALSSVVVPAEGRIVDTVALRRGSWCTMTLRADARNEVQSARATATFVGVAGDPEIVRAAGARKVAYRKGPVDRLVLTGLPAGTYDVALTVVVEHGPDLELRRRIKVDGKHDVAWPVDARRKKPDPKKK